MTPIAAAVRAGVARGGIELRQTLTTPQDLWGYLFPPVALLATMIFMGDATVPGTGFSLGARTLPSTLGMGVVFGGMVSLMMGLAVEREDGTLLRAKAVPNGMLGYLVGKVVLVAGASLVGMALILVPGLFLFGETLNLTAAAWFTLIWVAVLGLLATLPLGAIFGSLFSNPRNAGVIMLPYMGIIAASGIFYPINNFPQWLQWLAQAFPVYWLGLGMRSALLPGEMAAVEIDGSWRHLPMVGVLGAWTIAGFVVAPIILRRMARRESGSVVAARREKALQRVN
jgi:ABC-2 type transport system permease protein